MDELIAFLRAALDEDERVARKCAPGPWATEGEPRDTYVISSPGIAVAMGWRRDLEHIARWDPARVLAEVQAKRRILDEHPHDGDGFCGDGIGLVGCKWAYPCPTLRLLAQPYAGQPGWREEWQV